MITTEYQGEYYYPRDERQREVVLEAVRNMPLPFAAKLGPKEETRTKRQNRYIWGWVYAQISEKLEQAGIAIPCIGDTTHPYTTDILHELFKEKFLKKGDVEALNKRTGEIKTLSLHHSTTALTKKQFSMYVQKIKEFVFDFWGIVVEEPNSGYWAELYNDLRPAANDAEHKKEGKESEFKTNNSSFA